MTPNSPLKNPIAGSSRRKEALTFRQFVEKIRASLRRLLLLNGLPAARLVPLILVSILLSGCVPIPFGCIVVFPYTTVRSYQVEGTILDARTHAPVSGARVFLAGHPEVACKSDAKGHFRLKELHNWHVASIETVAGHGGDWPEGKDWTFDRTVKVIKQGYLEQTVDFSLNGGSAIVLTRPGETPQVWLTFNGKGEILQDSGGAQYLKPGDILIVGRFVPNFNNRPSVLHVGFVRQVFNPKITAVRQSDGPLISPARAAGFAWEFNIGYFGSLQGGPVDDAARVYRLEFIP